MRSAHSARVTIRDVARAAGVSRQTVTRAINDMPEISAQTRERVMRTVDELGYRPNRFAIDLFKQRTHTIGLLVRTFRNPYFAELADAVINEMQRRGWQVVVGTADQGEDEAIRAMAAQVDAIVGYFSHPPEMRGLPIVHLEHRATGPGANAVEFDMRAGVFDLVAALRARGSRRFGMIDALGPGIDPEVGTPRRRYFAEAVEDAVIVAASGTIAGGGDGIQELLERDPRIDTVLAFNDLMAMGAIHGAHLLDVRVPEAVRIIGIDGISLGEAMSPTLTTLSMQFDVVAAEVASVLVDLLSGDALPSASIIRTVTPVVLWRESA